MSRKERVEAIVIYILLRRESLSLEHLAQELDVSKNTILNDIRIANVEYLNKASIVYDRHNGYLIDGNEWDKRKLMVKSIISLASNTRGISFLDKIVIKDEFRQFRIKKMLEHIEEETHQSFVDIRLNTLSYEVEAIIQRIENAYYLSEAYPIEFEDLSDTKEYEILEKFLDNESIKLPQEKMFLALHLLFVNRGTSSQQENQIQILHNLKVAVDSFLKLYEKKAMVEFADVESLANKLFQHLKPAYYRIKYNLTTQYSGVLEFEEELMMVHYFVSSSLEPLKEVFQSEISYQEELLISLFISSHLTKKQKKELGQTKKKALVICPNGVTISTIVRNNLKDLFPEIEFKDNMSVREYEKTGNQYDIVFSTIPIRSKTDNKIYLVNKVMNNIEQLQLRERVMRELFEGSGTNEVVKYILSLIKKHADIKDNGALTDDLSRFVIQNNISNINLDGVIKKESGMDDLLSSNYIHIVREKKTWHEALEIASSNLLKNKIIEKRYVEEMKNQYSQPQENIIFYQEIAIAHAGVEDGVNALGMSLCVLKEPLYVNEKPLHFIAVIATPDKEQHFNSLMQLVELSQNKIYLEKILNANEEEEIEGYIKSFIKEKEL